MCAMVKSFRPEIGCQEAHILALPPEDGLFRTQVDSLFQDYQETLNANQLTFENGLWATFYMSDANNNEETLRQSELFQKLQSCKVAVSVIQMPPGSKKIALHAYHVSGNQRVHKQEIQVEGMKAPCKAVAVSTGGSNHIFLKNAIPKKRGCINDQAEQAFRNIVKFCTDNGFTFDDVIRTWIYVSDIDSNYAGMNAARNIIFDSQGVTPGQRFPASTGIQGRSGEANDLILLDAVILADIKDGQVKPIKALSHLNDTSDYAVRFERGVEVTYGDRTHYYISGTASISNKGEILFPCDVARQTDRVLENIDALLKSSGSRFEEMAYLIVYIRDMSDFSVVEQRLSEKLVKVPYIILHASVCRPGWLVEMEGIAISSKCGAGFPRF